MKLYTVGKLVERLRRPPGQIESAIGELTIAPTLELNGLAYFDGDAEAKIADELEQRELVYLTQRQKAVRPI